MVDVKSGKEEVPHISAGLALHRSIINSLSPVSLVPSFDQKIKGSEFKTTPPSDCVHAPPRSASTSMHCRTAISCSCALTHIRERWVFIHACNQSYMLVMQEVEYPSSEVHYLHSTSKRAPTPPFFHPKAKEGSITYFSLLWGNSTAVSSDDRGKQRVSTCVHTLA